MMKILISDTPPYFIAPDAPVLGAVPVTVDGRLLWRVWCKHCRHHHFHAPAAGHREAHCREQTPYDGTRYNLAANRS